MGTGFASVGIYDCIRRLSPSFGLDGNEADRPILGVLALFAASFALYFIAVAAFERAASAGHSCIVPIFLFAVLFRLEMLDASPIQERDIYRYIWDGDVGRLGVDPFGQSPEAVAVVHRWLGDSSAARGAPTGPQVHASWLPCIAVARELQSNKRMQSVLAHVYYPSVTTIYPPASQWCFRQLCTASHGWDADGTVLLFKTVFAALDLVVGILVAFLCRQNGLSGGWSLLYLWCPLVVKEFANSGHMDGLAIVPLLLSLLAAVAFASGGKLRWALVSGACLGMAGAAKFFPLALAPLVACRLWDTARCRPVGHHRRRKLLPFSAFLVGLALMLAAWFAGTATGPSRGKANSTAPVDLASLTNSDLPQWDKPMPAGGVVQGTGTFALRWEMNAFLYGIVRGMVECIDCRLLLEPLRAWAEARAPHSRLGDFIAHAVEQDAAGLLARIVVAVLFIGLLAFLCMQVQGADGRRFLELCFLALASLWLLSPTLNPWYTAWFLPMLPFVRVRAWRWLPAFAMLYYLRFWFEYANPAQSWLAAFNLPTGARFFDEVFVFWEFGPWFCWMQCASWRQRRRSHAVEP